MHRDVNVVREEKTRKVLTIVRHKLEKRMNMFITLVTSINIEKVFDRNYFVVDNVNIVRMFTAIPKNETNSSTYLKTQSIFVATMKFLLSNTTNYLLI